MQNRVLKNNNTRGYREYIFSNYKKNKNKNKKLPFLEAIQENVTDRIIRSICWPKYDPRDARITLPLTSVDRELDL